LVTDFHTYWLLFLRALALTIAIEATVIAIFFFLRGRCKRTSPKIVRIVLAGILPSCITLPFVWFLFPAIIENRMAFLMVAETFAFVAEIPLIKVIAKSTWPEAIAASILANGVSFASGYLFRIT
jgi:hypothetical protein